MLGFEALSALPLSALPMPAVVLVSVDGGSGAAIQWAMPLWPDRRRREEDEIVVLGRHVSGKGWFGSEVNNGR